MLGGTGCIYCTSSLNKKNMKIVEFLKQRHMPVYFITAINMSHIDKINTPIFFLNDIHGGVLETV